jgi:hypothetical protein
MYRLVVTTKSGNVTKHFYEDYDDLDYNATFCQFSPNILKAVGQKLTFSGWIDLFTIQ